jgi:peptide-methionine (R)-S-oxide reductase
VSDSNYRKDPEAVSQLTPGQYQVTQCGATEPAFRNQYGEYRKLFGPATDTRSAS